MRITCPCCSQRFDVPIRDVLTEAERIHARETKKILAPMYPPDPDGNVLLPMDLDAKRQRDEAVARRLPDKKK
jgi:hypothetical protein